MVQFQRHFGDTLALFIDGYCPGEEFYRSAQLRPVSTTKTGGGQLGKVISPILSSRVRQPLQTHGTLTPDQLIRVFAALVEGARAAYCPYDTAAWCRRGSRTPTGGSCLAHTFGAGDTYNSVGLGWRRERFAEHLPALQEEYAADPEARCGRYVQSLVLVPQSQECFCTHHDECAANWTRITTFCEKGEDRYRDATSFVGAWADIAEVYARRRWGLE